jgi:hypothetical protein
MPVVSSGARDLGFGLRCQYPSREPSPRSPAHARDDNPRRAIPAELMRGSLRNLIRSKRGCVLAPLSRRSDDLHLLPVVRKFSSTIQASHVGSGQRGGLWALSLPTNRYRKAEPGMPATKKHVKQFSYHKAPSTLWTSKPESSHPGCCERAVRLTQLL